MMNVYYKNKILGSKVNYDAASYWVAAMVEANADLSFADFEIVDSKEEQ